VGSTLAHAVQRNLLGSFIQKPTVVGMDRAGIVASTLAHAVQRNLLGSFIQNPTVVGMESAGIMASTLAHAVQRNLLGSFIRKPTVMGMDRSVDRASANVTVTLSTLVHSCYITLLGYGRMLKYRQGLRKDLINSR
jgi:hypothetical protein